MIANWDCQRDSCGRYSAIHRLREHSPRVCITDVTVDLDCQLRVLERKDRNGIYTP